MQLRLVRSLPVDIRTLLRAASVGIDSSIHKFAIFVYDVGIEHPARGYSQTLEFPAGSEQAAFFEQGPVKYTIICQPVN